MSARLTSPADTSVRNIVMRVSTSDCVEEREARSPQCSVASSCARTEGGGGGSAPSPGAGSCPSSGGTAACAATSPFWAYSAVPLQGQFPSTQPDGGDDGNRTRVISLED